MLQDSISKIKYLLVLALMVVIPMQAFAGALFSGDPFFDPIDQTDTGTDRLIYFYDTIDRSTYIQVTNTSDDFVQVHVQVFDASNNCAEFDFEVTLTPNDTNIYNIEELPGSPILSNTTGFVSISAFGNNVSDPLIGMFRIIDDSGYEYRTNAADSEYFGPDDGFFNDYVLNFNDVSGNNLSDVVGITYLDIDAFSVGASAGVGSVFGAAGGFLPVIYDEDEVPLSCPAQVFACVEGGPFSINKGIDNSIPNTHGYPRICNTSRLNESNTAGWLDMPFFLHVCDDPFFCEDVIVPIIDQGEAFVITQNFFYQPYFVGFLGLNNGNGTGSMDSWLAWGCDELDCEL